VSARGLLIAVALVATQASADELSDVAAKVKPAVVRLLVLDSVDDAEGVGTGFYVSATGQVVTNHHVMNHAARLVAISPDGTQRAVLGVLAMDEESDLALLQVEGPAPSFLPLGSSESIEDGAKVHVYGNPLGLSWTLSSGIISASGYDPSRSPHRRNGTPARVGRTLQVSASMMGAGNSGSPVFDPNGAVVGVIYSGVGESGGIGFAMPVEAVKTLIASAAATPMKLDEAQGRSLSDRNRNLILSALFFLGLAGWGLVQALRRRKHTRHF
jgi:S1-C subfamily serine protease